MHRRKDAIIAYSIVSSIIMLVVSTLLFFYYTSTDNTYVDTSTSSYISGNAKSIYVSTQGSDTASGTKDDPFLTIERAKSYVRELVSKGLDGNIIVYLRQGNYPISDTLYFESSDSGSDRYSITYRSYPNEIATIEGSGKLDSNWKNEGGNIWSIDVDGFTDSSGQVRMLYKNGNWVPVSTYPSSNSQVVTINSISNEAKSFVFNETIPYLGENPEYVSYMSWFITRVPVESQNGSSFNMRYRTYDLDNPPEWKKPKSGMFGKFENVALTADNRTDVWHFDETSKTLYYRALENEDPNKSNFVIPQLDQLIVLDGKGGSQEVQNIQFSDLEFQYSRGWQMPVGVIDGRNAYYEIQAARYANYLSGSEPQKVFPSAIELKGVKDVSFARNSFKNLGGEGVFIKEKSSDILFQANIFRDIGSTCLSIGEGYVSSGTEFPYKVEESVTNNIFIRDNSISNCGKISFGAVGIWQNYARYVEILNNDFTNLPYSAISIGFIFANKEVGPQSNIKVNYNKITNVMQVLADGGAIYTLGASPDSEIRNNFIQYVGTNRVIPHLSYAPPFMGIYFDNSSWGYRVSGNSVNHVHGNLYTFFQTFKGGEADQSRIYMGKNYLGVNYPSEVLNYAGVRGLVGPAQNLNTEGFYPDQFDLEFFAKEDLGLYLFQTRNTTSGKIEAKYSPQSSYWQQSVWQKTIDLPVNENTEYIVEAEHFDEGNNSVVFIQTKGTKSGKIEMSYAFPSLINDITFKDDPMIVDLDPAHDYQLEIEKAEDTWYLIVLQTTGNPSGKVQLHWLEIDWFKSKKGEFDVVNIHTQTLPYTESEIYKYRFDFETDKDGQIYIVAFKYLETDSGFVEFEWLHEASRFEEVIWPSANDPKEYGIIENLLADGTEYIFEVENLGLTVFYPDLSEGYWKTMYYQISDYYNTVIWDTTLPFNISDRYN